MVIGYCLFVGIVPGLALLTGRQPPSVPRWITFAILLVASTAVFIAVLFRMSLPAENKEKGK